MSSLGLTEFQILTIILIIIGSLWMLVIGRYLFMALLSGVRVSGIEIFFMQFRRSPVKQIIRELIKCAKNGIVVTRADLEMCYLAGGDVSNVVNGLITAKSYGITITVKEALNLDLQKRDLVLYFRNKQHQETKSQ